MARGVVNKHQADAIFRARMAMGLSQRGLTQKINEINVEPGVMRVEGVLEDRTTRRWERGESTPGIWLPLLCDALNRTPEQLGVLPGVRSAHPILGRDDVPVPYTLVGRGQCERDVEAAIVGERAALSHSGRAVILTGLGGLGKTALAATVALRLTQRQSPFPGGGVWLDCEGLRDARGARELWKRLARALGSAINDEDGIRAHRALALAHLKEMGQTLIVLDGLAVSVPSEPIDTLLTTKYATLLITARHFPALQTARNVARIPLEPLSLPAAATLLALAMHQKLPDHPSAEEFAILPTVVEPLGGLPLGIQLTAAYACNTTGSLAQLAAELAESRELASEIATGIDTCFERTWSALSPAAQSLLMSVALHENPSFPWEAAQTLEGALPSSLTQPTHAFRDGTQTPALIHDVSQPTRPKRGRPARRRTNTPLNDLLRFSLLEHVVQTHRPSIAIGDNKRPRLASPELHHGEMTSRLRLHPLVRAYALRKLHAAPDPLADDAQRALARYYAAYAERYRERPLQLAEDVIRPDEQSLLNSLRWARAHGEHALVAQITFGMASFWRVYHNHDGNPQHPDEGFIIYLEWGMDALHALIADTESTMTDSMEANANAALGSASGMSYDVAHELVASQHLDVQLPTRTQMYRKRLVRLEHTKGWILQHRGRLGEATELYERNLAQRLAIGDTLGAVSTLISLGELAFTVGALDTTVKRCAEARALLAVGGDASTEGNVFQLIGKVHFAQHEYEQARSAFEYAEACYQRSQNVWGITTICILRGFVALDSIGDCVQAVQWYDRANALDRVTHNVSLNKLLLARINLVSRRFSQADTLLSELRDTYQELGDQFSVSEIGFWQGELAFRRGKHDQARHLFGDALERARQIGALRLAGDIEAHIAKTPRGTPSHARRSSVR